VTHIAPAWARDANGRDVPTFYEIEETTLVQVVKHRGGDWAYGITADPSVWKVVKCAAAVTWVVGTSIFAVAKIAKIRGAIGRSVASGRPQSSSSERPAGRKR